MSNTQVTSPQRTADQAETAQAEAAAQAARHAAWVRVSQQGLQALTALNNS